MNLSPPAFPERNSLIIALRRDGLGPAEIHRRLRISKNVIAGVLHRAGMCAEKKGRGHGRPEAQKDALRADRRRGATYEQLAAKHGVSMMTAWHWVND